MKSSPNSEPIFRISPSASLSFLTSALFIMSTTPLLPRMEKYPQGGVNVGLVLDYYSHHRGPAPQPSIVGKVLNRIGFQSHSRSVGIHEDRRGVFGLEFPVSEICNSPVEHLFKRLDGPVHVPVFAIGKMERVDIPFAGGV